MVATLTFYIGTVFVIVRLLSLLVIIICPHLFTHLLSLMIPIIITLVALLYIILRIIIIRIDVLHFWIILGLLRLLRFASF